MRCASLGKLFIILLCCTDRSRRTLRLTQAYALGLVCYQAQINHWLKTGMHQYPTMLRQYALAWVDWNVRSSDYPIKSIEIDDKCRTLLYDYLNAVFRYRLQSERVEVLNTWNHLPELRVNKI